METLIGYVAGVVMLLLILATIGLVAELLGSIVDWARGKQWH
jgi:hypothetical protein